MCDCHDSGQVYLCVSKGLNPRQLDRLQGLVVKASFFRAEDPRFDSRLLGCFFLSGSSHTSDLKMIIQWLPCQAPGIKWSERGLVGPVSVYCDWVRWKVGSATSISMWQHEICQSGSVPEIHLACCWDVKQPTNQPTTVPHSLCVLSEVSCSVERLLVACLLA